MPFQRTKVYFQSIKVPFQRTNKYTFKGQDKISILSKYASILSKYKVTFGTLGTESPESGTFLIPLVPGTRFPEPVPSKPREQNLTRQNPSNGSRNQFPEPVPGTRFLPGSAPARPEHTEIYIAQRPHSILNSAVGEKTLILKN